MWGNRVRFPGSSRYCETSMTRRVRMPAFIGTIGSCLRRTGGVGWVSCALVRETVAESVCITLIDS